MKRKLSATMALLFSVCLLFMGCGQQHQTQEATASTPQTLSEYVKVNEESLHQLLGINDGDDVTLTVSENKLEICYSYPVGIHPGQDLLEHAAENNRLNWQEAADQMTQALGQVITVTATYQTNDGTVLASYECVGTTQQ